MKSGLRLTKVEKLREVLSMLSAPPMLVGKMQNKRLETLQRKFQLKLQENFQQFSFVSPGYSGCRFQWILFFLPSFREFDMSFFLSVKKKMYFQYLNLIS